MMDFQHISVMPTQVLAGWVNKKDGIYIDATLGGGGHSYLLLSQNPSARLIGIDRDADALAAAKQRLAPFLERVAFVKGNFHDIKSLVPEKVDGILMDLGVSSWQLDAGERGFSYKTTAPLDMRMDKEQAFSAFDVVNGYEERELIRVLRDYGEERFASRIARNIIAARPIETTTQLSDIIISSIPAPARRTGPHPARRSFQAIRIEVNGELLGLKEALEDAAEMLLPGGRLAVITFHSLEDRIAKTVFNTLAHPCTCPPKAPICICGKQPTIKLLERKPLIADEKENEQNARARSAKLRVIEKL